MKILLFSEDEALADLCREISVEMLGTESKLEVAHQGEIPSRKDVCLWDFIPGRTEIPGGLDAPQLRKHLFLLHRNDLPVLEELLGTSEIKVLLKPVTAATLCAFLGDAYQHEIQSNNRPARNIDSLHAERTEMFQFLIQANLKLQEFDQERTNFLARSIHDVRAPLTAISGYCGLLLDEDLGPLTVEQKEVLARMQHSAVRLSRIASAMLQLSIRGKREQTFISEPGDMRDCVDQALHEVALLLEEKRIGVRVDIDQPAHGLFFCKSQIEQMLVNLLDNACKFTPRNGTIEIRGYPFFWDRRTELGRMAPAGRDRRVRQVTTPNSMRVDIRDSGPGIQAVHLRTIFDEYTSYAGGQDRSGGGLGLAICRMILQQHRGKIWAESHPAGAVFSFILPLRARGAHAAMEQNGHAASFPQPDSREVS